MKKLVLFAVVAFAVSFASCGNKAKEDAAKADDAIVEVQEVIEVQADSIQVLTDSIVAAE
jgi:outer membrane murein-binding lipoprotein Lpp